MKGRPAESAPPASLRRVRDFWQSAACGEIYAHGSSVGERLESQARARYQLEPFVRDFARFEEGHGQDVLEVGVGMGADHLEWGRASPRSLTGVDLTPQAIAYTRARLNLHGVPSRLIVANAEHLPFRDESFDLVYSWGVIHHTPATGTAAREIVRVLRPGGHARVMIYHRRSLVGAMLWLRYALLAGRPLRSLDHVYARHLESPGTKAYTPAQARELFAGLCDLQVRVELSPGDLLGGATGQAHGGPLLTVARRVYPRRAVRRLLPAFGLYLLLSGRRAERASGTSRATP